MTIYTEKLTSTFGAGSPVLKLEPQPQEPLAFEFVSLKPGSIKSFEKSIMRPFKYTELILSETMRSLSSV